MLALGKIRHNTYIYIRVNQIDIYMQVFVGMFPPVQRLVFLYSCRCYTLFWAKPLCMRLTGCPPCVHHVLILDETGLLCAESYAFTCTLCAVLHFFKEQMMSDQSLSSSAYCPERRPSPKGTRGLFRWRLSRLDASHANLSNPRSSP
jgi:hypothetical protein